MHSSHPELGGQGRGEGQHARPAGGGVQVVLRDPVPVRVATFVGTGPLGIAVAGIGITDAGLIDTVFVRVTGPAEIRLVRGGDPADGDAAGDVGPLGVGRGVAAAVGDVVATVDDAGLALQDGTAAAVVGLTGRGR
jgi:hypothetical protein